MESTKESTKEKRVWHSGPPPHVGWWNASVNQRRDSWRWWTGECWSHAAKRWADGQQAAVYSRRSAGILAAIEWSDYWPADARVPRLAPEDFEIGARWVCAKPSAVAFVGEEFTVHRWSEHGLFLATATCMVRFDPEELPSEKFVPRRCVGPQTRWDFPVLLGQTPTMCQTDEALQLPNLRDLARAQVLTAKGYRRVSNAHNIVARIDRPDWVDVLAKALHRAPADFYVPGQSKPAGNWCDHYRRVYTQDEQTVDKAVAKLVPTSGHDNVGYVPPFKAEIR